MYFISPKSFDFVCVFFPVFCFFTTCSLFLLKLHFYLKKLQFLSPNSMNTSSFSCFISKSFDFCLYPSWCGFDVLHFPSPSSTFSFFYLYICICMRFFFVFCFFTACSLFLLKLHFFLQKTLIFGFWRYKILIFFSQLIWLWLSIVLPLHLMFLLFYLCFVLLVLTVKKI